MVSSELIRLAKVVICSLGVYSSGCARDELLLCVCFLLLGVVIC